MWTGRNARFVPPAEICPEVAEHVRGAATHEISARVA